MIVSPNDLRRDLVQIVKRIDAQIAEVDKQAEEMGISSAQMRDYQNNWVMTPLLLAKAQAYGALVQLNEQEKSKRDRR